MADELLLDGGVPATSCRVGEVEKVVHLLVLNTVHINGVARASHHSDAGLLFDDVVSVTLVCRTNSAFTRDRSCR